MAMVSNALGFELFLASDNERAVAILEESVELARKAGDQGTRLAALRTLKLVHVGLAAEEDIRRVAGELLALATTLEDEEAIAAARESLGFADQLLDADGEWQRQVDFWTRQLDGPTFDAAASFDSRAVAARMLMTLYEENQVWEEARRVGEEHLEYLKEKGEPLEIASWRTLLSTSALAAGEIPRAIRDAERALEDLDRVDPSTSEESSEREAIRARARRDLSMAYQAIGDDASAVDVLEGRRATESGNVEPHDLANRIRLALLRFQDGWSDSLPEALRRAEEALEEVLNEAESPLHRAQALDALAYVAYVRGEDENLRKALRHTLAASSLLRSHKGATFPWIERGLLAAHQEKLAYIHANLGQDEEALRYARQAIENGANAFFGDLLGHNAEGYAHLRAGRWTEAEEALRKTIAGWERLQQAVAEDERLRASVLDAQLSSFELLQETLIRRERPEAALEVAERARARALGATLAREDELDEVTIGDMRALARRTGAALLSWSILYDPYKSPSPARVRGRQADLERVLLVGLITPAGTVHSARVDLETMRLQHEPTLESMIRRVSSRSSSGYTEFDRGLNKLLRQGSGSGLRDLKGSQQEDPAREDEALSKLYRLLVEPIEEHLPTGAETPLVLVPQGRLFQVPFAALRNAEGRHLVQDHPLLVVPSLGVLDILSRKPRSEEPWQADEVLVVGDPKYAVKLDLAQLPGAREEAIQVANGWGTEPLLGDMATLDEVTSRLRKARLVHLATHAWPTSDAPGSRFPGNIAVAPNPGKKGAQENNGLLSADRIRGLASCADLVVLSACDTGGGRLTSDGVLGLARSFLASGTRRVVVSLWRVPDEPTRELMVGFHERLREGDEVSKALQQVMVQAIEDERPFSEWAAFVALGAPGL